MTTVTRALSRERAPVQRQRAALGGRHSGCAPRSLILATFACWGLMTSGPARAARAIDAPAAGSAIAQAHENDTASARERMLQTRPYAYLPGSTSKFWGSQGELYDPNGRVADYSYAGAWMGEKEVPPPAGTSYDLVRDFGANGNDGVSDIPAFRQAIATLKSGDTLTIPPGTFIVDQQIFVAKGISIRGAGRDQTTLYMPKCLNELYPNAWKPGEGSPWSDARYFLNFESGYTMDSSTWQGNVVGVAPRGSVAVTVQLRPGGYISPGDIARFTASDREGALVNYLYAGQAQDRSDQSLINKPNLIHFASPVLSVTPAGGDRVFVLQLQRPLAYDLRPDQWSKVEVHKFTSKYVFGAGVADLSLEFAPSLYAGHRKELGYNALGFVGCVHCWAVRLRIINHDFGISLGSSYFVTVDDIIMTNTLDRTGGNKKTRSGHHQIRMSRTTDSLAQNIQMDRTYYHDVSLDKMSALNVYHSISGPDLVLDFHGSAVNMNLHSRINCGACLLAYRGGGAADSGGYAGKLNALWGLQGGNDGIGVWPPPVGFAAEYTAVAPAFITLPWQDPSFVVEPLNPSTLQPWDLRAAMFARRMSLGLRWYNSTSR